METATIEQTENFLETLDKQIDDLEKEIKQKEKLLDEKYKLHFHSIRTLKKLKKGADQ